MKNTFSIFTATILVALVFSQAKAQTTAMDFYGMDCNGNMHDMIGELDAGKAVILHFYMPSCGSCPPPAQKIQAMANNILATYPGMITAYAFPFQNSTTCSYSSGWVANNNLSLYAPMDSGATQVAHYGGFGMPTVVLLGGSDHRVMFSTLNFVTSDTTIMRDSILNLLGGATGVVPPMESVQVAVFPNPAGDVLQLDIQLATASHVKVDLLNVNGQVVGKVMDEDRVSGSLRMAYPVRELATGTYFIRVTADGQSQVHKINVQH